MKYLFTPNDFAVFFIVDDFTVKKRFKTICHFFKYHSEMLSVKYRSNEIMFRRAVNNEMLKLELSRTCINEINQIMDDIGSCFHINSDSVCQDIYAAYFKIVKLKLMYGNNNYYKKKLRILIKQFGYKRRTQLLIDTIHNTLYKLELKPYLRKHTTCNVGDVKLDDMIIIRLK